MCNCFFELRLLIEDDFDGAPVDHGVVNFDETAANGYFFSYTFFFRLKCLNVVDFKIRFENSIDFLNKSIG